MFPFSAYLDSYTAAMSFKLLRTFKVPRFYFILKADQIEKIIEALMQNKSQRDRFKLIFGAKNIYRIVTLVISASILTYFLGCFWYLIVYKEAEDGPGDNFFNNNLLGKETYLRRLIICCYFVMTTLSTVGYGDYTPLTILEKFVTIFIMVIGIALFSYIMGICL